MRRIVPVICSLSLLFGTPSRSSAQPPAQPGSLREAEQRFNEGKELIKQRRWAEARMKFVQACAVHRTMNCPKNLGTAEYELGMYAEATQHLGEFLRNNDLPKNDPILVAIQGFYDTSFAKSGHLEVVAPDGAAISVDGTAVGNAPIAEPVHVMPGAHTLQAQLTDGRAMTASTTVDAGKKVRVSLVPEPSPPATPSSVASTQPAKPTQGAVAAPETMTTTVKPTANKTQVMAGLVVGVAAIAALAGGVVFGAIGSSHEDDANAMRAGRPCAERASSACSAYQTTLDDQQTAATTSRIFYVAGGVLAVTAAAILFWPRSTRNSSARSMWLAPSVADRAGGINVGGSF